MNNYDDNLLKINALNVYWSTATDNQNSMVNSIPQTNSTM